MVSAELIQTIHRKYSAILLDLDERGSRRWAAAEAMAIGRGGITAVSKATGNDDLVVAGSRGRRSSQSSARLSSN